MLIFLLCITFWLAAYGLLFMAFLSWFVYISFVYKRERHGDLRSMF